MAFEVSLGPKLVVERKPPFGGGRPSQYPWDQLQEPTTDPETGEMLYSQFFVPGKTAKSFSSNAHAAAEKLHMTFSVHDAEMEIDGEPVAGVLVQRVEYREPKRRTEEEKAAMAAKRAANKAAREAAKAAEGAGTA